MVAVTERRHRVLQSCGSSRTIQSSIFVRSTTSHPSWIMSGRKWERVPERSNAPMSRSDDSAQSAPEPNEQQFIMTRPKSWEEARAEGRAEGRAEARAEGWAKDISTVLRVRGIEVPEAARKRILAQRDIDQLKRWHENAVLASTIEDVLDDPR